MFMNDSWNPGPQFVYFRFRKFRYSHLFVFHLFKHYRVNYIMSLLMRTIKWKVLTPIYYLTPYIPILFSKITNQHNFYIKLQLKSIFYSSTGINHMLDKSLWKKTIVKQICTHQIYVLICTLQYSRLKWGQLSISRYLFHSLDKYCQKILCSFG